MDGDRQSSNEGSDIDNEDIGTESEDDSLGGVAQKSGAIVDHSVKKHRETHKRKEILLRLSKLRGKVERDKKKMVKHVDKMDDSVKTDMTSMFVGSLSGTVKRQAKKTRNRMGQRARRQ